MKWLHLSDLHLIFNNYETTLMRANFFEYLQNFESQIDCLFITGDITHQGRDYTQEIITFLNEIVTTLKISKENVYMIPGNHDVKRSDMAQLLIQGILSKENGKDAINEIDIESFNTLFNGQTAYIKLYESFLERDYPKDKLHFVIKTEDFNIIHINTCLLAAADNIEGRILVGLNKLLETTLELKDEREKVTFAIGHHTVDCINKDEKTSFLNRLSDNKIDFYLCGHVHKSEINKLSNNYNTTHTFTAGSNLVDGYGDTLFIEGDINFESGESEVSYHYWNKNTEVWQINNDIDRRLVNGKYKFKIKKKKKKMLKKLKF